MRAWLDSGRPVALLDVRPLTERQEWAIPGSLHVDASEALKAHDPEALSGMMLPTDRPVVTVCGAGRTSQIAAEQLAARGLDVYSLEGGMKAWSLAWNSAQIALPRRLTFNRRVSREYSKRSAAEIDHEACCR